MNKDVRYRHTQIGILFSHEKSFPGDSDGKESACNVGDLGSNPGLGTSPRERKGYPLQYSGLEDFMNYSPWHQKELDMTEQLSLSNHHNYL